MQGGRRKVQRSFFGQSSSGSLDSLLLHQVVAGRVPVPSGDPADGRREVPVEAAGSGRVREDGSREREGHHRLRVRSQESVLFFLDLTRRPSSSAI